MQTLEVVYRFLLAIKDQPETLPTLLDSVSAGQVKSKQWVIDELIKLDLNLGTVFLCAGWYGTLAYMLFQSNLKLEKIRSFDIDSNCYKIAERINKPYVTDNWKFKASTLDINELSYDNFVYDTYRSNGTDLKLVDTANTIINTSCEHIENFDSWYSKIPEGKIVILQTNNYVDLVEHVNCYMSLDEFKLHAPMSSVLYEGILSLEKYDRFMLIGIR